MRCSAMPQQLTGMDLTTPPSRHQLLWQLGDVINPTANETSTESSPFCTTVNFQHTTCRWISLTLMKALSNPQRFQSYWRQRYFMRSTRMTTRLCGIVVLGPQLTRPTSSGLLSAVTREPLDGSIRFWRHSAVNDFPTLGLACVFTPPKISCLRFDRYRLELKGVKGHVGKSFTGCCKVEP